jgi:VanZ family protein
MALIYALLVAYASLYPFSGWRNQGLWFGAFLNAGLPRYWTGFDVWANFLGYAPLGFFLVLAQLRGTRSPERWTRLKLHPVATASLMGIMLSFWFESLQLYLPSRVPSNLDFALNGAGTLLGAGVAWHCERRAWLARWTRFRQTWFDPDARAGLLLLALWPLALLFPEATPFGLGQVWQRLLGAVQDHLDELDNLDLLYGLFERHGWLDWLNSASPSAMLSSTAQMVCAAQGLLLPVLLAYSVMHQVRQRLLAAVVIFALGSAVLGLSSALSYGPAHTLVWLNTPVILGLLLAALLSAVLCGVTRRMAVTLGILSIGIGLTLLNQASVDSYLAHNLQTWEQGRFIRFSGLAQWLGWCWPYAALAYLLRRMARRDAS